MKTELANLMAQLSLADIQALAKMKAAESKELPRLKRQRAKVAAKLAALDRKIIAMLQGKPAAVQAQKPAQKAIQKPAKAVKAAPKAVKAVTVAKVETAPKAGKPTPAMKGIVEAVKKALSGGKKMKVAEVLESMVSSGFKVPNPAKAKKSIRALLIGQKKCFKKVSEGVYTLA